MNRILIASLVATISAGASLAQAPANFPTKNERKPLYDTLPRKAAPVVESPNTATAGAVAPAAGTIPNWTYTTTQASCTVRIFSHPVFLKIPLKYSEGLTKLLEGEDL